MSVKPTEKRPVNQQERWCAAATNRLLPSQTLLSLWNRLYGAFFACIINYGRVNHLLMFGRFLASHYFIVANPSRTVVYDAISVAFTAFCSFSSVLSSRLTLLSHTSSVPFFFSLFVQIFVSHWDGCSHCKTFAKLSVYSPCTVVSGSRNRTLRSPFRLWCCSVSDP